MFYGNTYQMWETTQQLVFNYDLFSQIVHLDKAMVKQTFFCFSATFICKVCWTIATCLECNFFQILVCVIFIVAGDSNINLP